MMSCTIGGHDAAESIDRRSLERLCGELGDDGSATHEFISMFVRLWPQRVSRVTEAVRQKDGVALVDAALSIRSASRMIGATRLGSFVDELIPLARARNFAQAGELLPRLAAEGDCAVRCLARLIDA